MIPGPDAAYDRLLDVLGALFLLVVLAMLLERALALVFEYHWFRRLSARFPGLKTPIALLVCWFTCQHIRFDILARLFSNAPGDSPATEIGVLITSAVVAGGSAAAITLFQGVLHFGRDARLGLMEANRAAIEAKTAEARLRVNRAEAASFRDSTTGFRAQGADDA
ncbi:MAG: hypothetical protein RBR38_00590 [Desulfomicrobium apsheronum]|nr:hypothetical protein [Desulfomicrobium apsheronum]